MASPYTDERLIEILRNLANELGRPPTAQELRARRDLPAPITYLNHFGGWNAALETAGLEPNRWRPSCTDEQLLDTLRTLADELGRPPTCREMRARRDLPDPGTYSRRFGSWSNALETAGLEARYCRTPDYTDEQLLQALRDLAAELGRTPTGREMQDRRDLPSPRTCQIRFGSWNAALEAAGLEPNRRQHSPARAEGET